MIKTYRPEILSIKHLHFVAIGKIRFKMINQGWTIPHLHYMINKINDNLYEAMCLETRTFATSTTIEDVAKQINLNIFNYIKENIKKADDLDKIIENLDDHFLDSYWKEYRKINFYLAKKGRDINTSMEDKIRSEIEKELNDKTKIEDFQFHFNENKKAA